MQLASIGQEFESDCLPNICRGCCWQEPTLQKNIQSSRKRNGRQLISFLAKSQRAANWQIANWLLICIPSSSSYRCSLAESTNYWIDKLYSSSSTEGTQVKRSSLVLISANKDDILKRYLQSFVEQCLTFDRGPVLVWFWSMTIIKYPPILKTFRNHNSSAPPPSLPKTPCHISFRIFRAAQWKIDFRILSKI